MAFKKGDIIWVSPHIRNPSELRHPAVIWDDLVDDEVDFHGIMLSHAEPSDRFNNILMSDEHFETGHEVDFSETHFVNQLFNKFQDWGPFYKAGELTSSGIEFIESNLSQIEATSFENYK